MAAVHKLQKDLKKESTSESASVGDAVALVFIGMLSMAILFFYLTQSGDASMRGSAWTVISDSTSLFCAILFYNILSDLMAMMSSKNDEQVRIGLAFTRLFVLFIGVEVSLVFLRRRPVPLAAAGLIGAHVLGFTAVDAFGEMQMAEPFRDKIGHCFAAVIIAVALFIAMCSIAYVARQLLVHKKGGQDWDHDWDHQCEHTEDEAMAFGFGLLISQVIRFSILGYLPPLNGSSSKKKGGQILLLWTAAMGMSLLVLALAFLKAWIPRIYSKVQRALGLLQATAGMTMAWCLVFWLKWIYKTHGKGLMRYSSNMYVLFWMAMIWTTLGFAVICIIDKVASRIHISGLRSLVDAWILLIGLSWEKSFIQAFSGLSMDEGHKAIKHLMRAGLLVFTIPAWLIYMLPKTPRMQDHGHGHEEHHDEHEQQGEYADGEEYLQGELHPDDMEHVDDDYGGWMGTVFGDKVEDDQEEEEEAQEEVEGIREAKDAQQEAREDTT